MWLTTEATMTFTPGTARPSRSTIRPSIGRSGISRSTTSPLPSTLSNWLQAIARLERKGLLEADRIAGVSGPWECVQAVLAPCENAQRETALLIARAGGSSGARGVNSFFRDDAIRFDMATLYWIAIGINQAAG